MRQLPGFTLDEGADLRGFGATAGNVLIDGQRPSSKTSITDELGRIAAGSVLRVELIRASAAGDLDVRGYTELANVVLKPATGMQDRTTFAATRAGTSRAASARSSAARVRGRPTISASVSACRRRASASARKSRRTFRNALGAVTRTQDEFYQNQVTELTITGAANWTPTPRDTCERQLPHPAAPVHHQCCGERVRAARSADRPVRYALDYTEKDIWYVDLGGDYEHKFDGQNAVKLITVNRLVNWRPQQLLTQKSRRCSSAADQQIDNSDNRGRRACVARRVDDEAGRRSTRSRRALESAYNYRDVESREPCSVRSADRSRRSSAFRFPRPRSKRTGIEASINDVWRINPAADAGGGLQLRSIDHLAIGRCRAASATSPIPSRALSRPGRQARRTSGGCPSCAMFRSSISATSPPGLNSISSSANIGNPLPRARADLEGEPCSGSARSGQRGSISLTGFYDDIEDTQDFILSRRSAPALQRRAGNDPAGAVHRGRQYRRRHALGRADRGDAAAGSVGVAGGILKLNVGAQDSRSDRSASLPDAADFRASRNSTGRPNSGRTFPR